MNDKNLLSSNQSGFRPGDTYVHQMLAITNDMFKAFDTNQSLEVRVIILEFSKAFDRVSFEGLMTSCSSWKYVESILD